MITLFYGLIRFMSITCTGICLDIQQQPAGEILCGLLLLYIVERKEEGDLLLLRIASGEGDMLHITILGIAQGFLGDLGAGLADLVNDGGGFSGLAFAGSRGRVKRAWGPA